MPTLPRGLSSADFSAALGKFAAALGADQVVTADEDVALYRDAYSPLSNEPDEIVASAAVVPMTVEQVQAVVRGFALVEPGVSYFDLYRHIE